MDASNLIRKIGPLKYLVPLAFILVGYTLIYTLLFGDTGFSHDEWRFLDIAYQKPLYEAIQAGIYEFSRPLISIPEILTYRAVGFQDIVFNLISGLGRVFSILLMSLALAWAWPHKMRWVVLVTLGTFFLPPLTSTTYTFAIDAVWQAMTCFWLCVLCWQFGVHFSGIGRLAFIGGGIFLGMSLLTYENALVLFPVGGLLAGCVLIARYPRPKTWLLPGILWAASVMIGYLIYVVIRARYGIHLHSSFRGLPSPEIWLNYLLTLIKFFGLPPTLGQASLLDLLIAAGAGIGAWWLMGYSRDIDTSPTRSSHSVVFLFGSLAFGLGVVPYIFTGYPALWEYSVNARIASAGALGVVSLLCWFLPRRGRLWPLTRLVAAIWIGIMALFPLTSRYDVQEASRLRQQFMMDLIQQAPRLQPDTHVIWVDTDIRVGSAPVTGWGLRFINIFYDSSTAWISLTPTARVPINISSQGVPAAEKQPMPMNSLVIFQRQGNHLVLIDCLRQDGPVPINWQDGITEICTNKDRILPDPELTNLTRLQSLGLLPAAPPFGPLPE